MRLRILSDFKIEDDIRVVYQQFIFIYFSSSLRPNGCVGPVSAILTLQGNYEEFNVFMMKTDQWSLSLLTVCVLNILY